MKSSSNSALDFWFFRWFAFLFFLFLVYLASSILESSCAAWPSSAALKSFSLPSSTSCGQTYSQSTFWLKQMSSSGWFEGMTLNFDNCLTIISISKLRLASSLTSSLTSSILNLYSCISNMMASAVIGLGSFDSSIWSLKAVAYGWFSSKLSSEPAASSVMHCLWLFEF